MNRFSRFCDRCGNKLMSRTLPPTCAPEDWDDWPKLCPEHGHVWANSTFVGVALIPVFHPSDNTKIGLLVGQRNHEPAKGLFGLPGGFQNDTPEGETIRQCAKREVMEETGVNLNEESLMYVWEYPNPAQCQTLVFFAYCRTLELGKDVHLGPCDVSPECNFIDVIWNPTTLAFNSHTEAARRWFLNSTSPY